MSDFIDKIKEIEKDLISGLKRIPVDSCLKVYYGITIEKYSRISFISSKAPFELDSTKELRITQGKESEKVYWTCFDLVNEEAKDVFLIFCDSLIKVIENIGNELEALKAIKERYYSWRLLLKNKGKMSYETYMGLFGELYFLTEKISKKTDISTAINSWVGPDGYSKDFSVNNTWYEVKAIGTSSTTIRINSLAQLDSNVKGYLVTIVVERMSDEFNSGLCSVSLLYNHILSKIADPKIKEIFVNKVLKYGYIINDSENNQYRFEVKKINYYGVDGKFPRLTREVIKTNAISQVSYELMLNAIDEYAEDL